MRVGCQIAVVYAATKGYLDSVPVKSVPEYEKRLCAKLENERAEWLGRVESGVWEKAEEEELKEILKEMQV
jgi:F-type H+-transporting ATPase subunit alpha